VKNRLQTGIKLVTVWEILGEKFNMSSGTAKDYYYRVKQEFDPKDIEGE
jgi:hypothetical protein